MQALEIVIWYRERADWACFLVRTVWDYNYQGLELDGAWISINLKQEESFHGQSLVLL